MTSTLRRTWPWWLVGLLLLARVTLSAHQVERPGLQYDELLFVNAATERQHGLFMFKELAGVPVMVFPYIGALKSWLLAPVFSLFHVRPTTIRMPPVLIATAGMGALVAGVRSLLGWRVAALVLAATILQASVFWLTRDDVGPSAIEFACKCAAIGCAARLALTGRSRWIFALVAVLALGTFNKLNFIWTVNGFVLAGAVAVVWHRRALFDRHRRQLVHAGGALAVLYAAFGWYYLHYDIGSYDKVAHTGSLLSYTWPRFERGTNAALSGSAFHELAIGPAQPQTAVTLAFLALAVAGAALALLRPATRNWFVACSAVVALAVAVQTLITPTATAPWHYVGILPFATIAAAYGVEAGAATLLRGDGHAVTVAVAVAAALALVHDGAQYRRDARALSHAQTTTLWTTEIYPLAGWANRQPGTIVTGDWGMYNQIWALEPGVRHRLLDVAFAARAGDTTTIRNALSAAPRPVNVLVHGPSNEAFPGSRAAVLRALGPRPHLATAFSAPRGGTMYEVYGYR